MTPQEYMANRDEFVRQMSMHPTRFRMGPDLPIIHEDKEQGFDRQYIYHCAWAARTLKRLFPSYHVDIGSSLYFVAMLAAFIPVAHYDFRPPDLHIQNLAVGHADLLHLSFETDSVMSLSCMHTVEHVGLGRYGDSIDSEGDLKAMCELKRVVAPGGHLLFVVPLGDPIIFYNAHRQYAREQIVDAFTPMKLEDFVDYFGAGCFLLTKGAV